MLGWVVGAVGLVLLGVIALQLKYVVSELIGIRSQLRDRR